ncbi:hypothetical protein Fmac_020680 [Flemingia macrophylla]|uniref:thermospermine synthase n=1 Tax=Flemingia macrophylla TaxID=520843 RepID=A0ABD1LUP3_9FABA
MGKASIIWLCFRALSILFLPSYSLNQEYFELNLREDEEERSEDDFPGDVTNGRLWFEQEIDTDVKWSLALDTSRVVFETASDFQNLSVLSTKRFGKALVIDGHLQNTELDEYIYHENLVHPALLLHNDIPKTVFIMGGGGGSAAREVLKHKDIEKVIICDIDTSTANLIHEHMTANHLVFNDERLQLVENEAKYELEMSEEKFDVIIGDLSDPDQSGPVHIYTQSFYENVAKPKLKDNGIFVTQASNEPFNFVAEELDRKIGERVRDELRYIDGPVILASTVLNKTLRNSLMEETRILTNDKVMVGFVRKAGVRRYA